MFGQAEFIRSTRVDRTIQGYLSFWNDNISYALRGCILIELALRRRIGLVKDPNRRRVPLPERLVEVIDERQTGETILDEALKLMKMQQETEKLGVNSWIDLLSGTSHFHEHETTLKVFYLLFRRNMERHEDWLPTQTSPRTSRKRSC